MSTLRILGIDPGYDRVGWAVVAVDGQKLSVVKSGCIVSESKNIFDRYMNIFHTLVNSVKELKPAECGIESLFFERNVSTAMRVSEARGVIIMALLQGGVSVHEYTPLQIKAAVTGNGRATKPEVERMVKLLTKLEKMPKLDDEVDAIAAAICHASSRKLSTAKGHA
ncbi:MAG TPA: crossover junction endodeoxyribonuclease RuvC [Candidatus Saccharimonadia bacterium]|nr:crossover junction endodeoxyribonuclease RuvC [Candidatus Saccharimonadia bacterium]